MQAGHRNKFIRAIFQGVAHPDYSSPKALHARTRGSRLIAALDINPTHLAVILQRDHRDFVSWNAYEALRIKTRAFGRKQ